MAVERGSRGARWLAKVAAGLFVFWLAFRDVDLDALGRAFGLVDLRWIAAAVISVFLTVLFLTARWALLLGLPWQRATGLVLMHAIILSQVANIVMPLKLGDAFRIGAVSRSLQVPSAEILASVAVERFYDAVMLGLTAALLAAVGVLPVFARTGLLALAGGIAAAVGVGVAVRYWPGGWRRFWRAAGRRIPGALASRIEGQLETLDRGLTRAARPRLIAGALGVSAAVMLGSALTAYLVLRAFAIDAPALSAAVIVIVLQVGNVVIPVPGAVGVFQVLTVQTLAIWGIPEAPALAYALVLYLVSRGPKLLLLPFAWTVLVRRGESRS